MTIPTKTISCPRCNQEFTHSNKIFETCPKCDSEFENTEYQEKEEPHKTTISDEDEIKDEIEREITEIKEEVERRIPDEVTDLDLTEFIKVFMICKMSKEKFTNFIISKVRQVNEMR